MYTSRPNAFSGGFSKNKIKIINRMISQEIRNYYDHQDHESVEDEARFTET